MYMPCTSIVFHDGAGRLWRSAPTDVNLRGGSRPCMVATRCVSTLDPCVLFDNDGIDCHNVFTPDHVRVNLVATTVGEIELLATFGSNK
jgi:hypothetical protein